MRNHTNQADQADQYILTPYFLDRYDPALLDLAREDWVVVDPDLHGDGEMDRTLCVHRPIADRVAEAATAGKRPVSVAGDCCATIPVMAGLQRAGIRPVFLWLDAHGDFNTWETTPSGFLGGMPLAMMVGLGEQTMIENVGMDPIPEADVVLSDGRDLDPGERKLVEGSRMKHLSDPLDLLDCAPSDRPVYIHFDTDILDPSEAPAMGYPAPGGPPSADLERVFRHLAEHCDVAALSISTWRSNMDEDGRSRSVCMGLFDILAG